MIGEIIAVGTELLMGQVVNTDAQFLAKQMADGTGDPRQPLGSNHDQGDDADHHQFGKADVKHSCQSLNMGCWSLAAGNQQDDQTSSWFFP